MSTSRVKNIYQENEIYYPEEFESMDKQALGIVDAMSFIERVLPGKCGCTESLHYCIRQAAQQFGDHRSIVGFCAQSMFFENSVVNRGRGLWKSNEEFSKILQDSYQFGKEVVVRDDGCIRFYALCRVRILDSFSILNAVRCQNSCFAVFDDLLDVRDVKIADDFYHASFPEHGETNVQWSHLIRTLAKGARGVIRVTGTHDDPEVSLDIFNSKSWVNVAL